MLGEEHGTRFEHECYDVGHLYNLAHFVDRGLVKPPFFVQTIFGILGGIGADMRNLMFMKETADRLFGDDYRWSVLAAGRSQIPFATQAAMMGGNVRVGLEDSLFIGRGKLAVLECRAGRQDPPHRRGARPQRRDAGRGARDSGAEGRRQRRLLATIRGCARRGMRFEDANEMLKPGYQPFESGYQELEDGKWVVAGLTRMAGCRAKMVDWWFRLARRHRMVSPLASDRPRLQRLGKSR